jgi:hypothetical protein
MEKITLPELDTSDFSTGPKADKIYNDVWNSLTKTSVVEPHQVRPDLMTWRRGSAQLALKVNPALDNLSIYSVLVSGVAPSEELFRYLLSYNVRQRRESLGLLEKDGKTYIVLKYTMELELSSEEVLQRHIYAMQEIADRLDTELVGQFGGNLQFEEWKKLDQASVDKLLGNLFD